MRDLRFEQRWLVADIVTPLDPGYWDGVHQVCDSTRAATFMRIGKNRYRWEFQLLPGETGTDYDDHRRLRQLLEPWWRGVPDDFELVRTGEYTFRAQLADRWRRGRVYLL